MEGFISSECGYVIIFASDRSVVTYFWANHVEEFDKLPARVYLYHKQILVEYGANYLLVRNLNELVRIFPRTGFLVYTWRLKKLEVIEGALDKRGRRLVDPTMYRLIGKVNPDGLNLVSGEAVSSTLPRKVNFDLLPGVALVEEKDIFQSYFSVGRSMVCRNVIENFADVGVDEISAASMHLMEFGDQVRSRLPGIYADIARKHPQFIALFKSYLDQELLDLEEALIRTNVVEEASEPSEGESSSQETVVGDTQMVRLQHEMDRIKLNAVKNLKLCKTNLPS